MYIHYAGMVDSKCFHGLAGPDLALVAPDVTIFVYATVPQADTAG